jgi:uncharacterized protein (TIGR01777 family)
MKVVVAGGSGLIGRHLVRALLADDHEVVVLSREPNRTRGRQAARVSVVEWDPTGRDMAWADRLANSAAVVNLCAPSGLSAISSLVDAIASLPSPERPRALVSASSIDIYADGRDEAVTETTCVGQSARAQLWTEWEAAAQAAERLAVRVVLLRTALVIAPDAPALERLTLPFRLFVGGPIGSGSQWVSWIGIEDAVSLIARAICSWDISGPLNLAAPEPVRQREFATILGHVLGRPSSVRLPAWLVQAALGDQATLLLGSRRVWPAKALAASYEFARPDLAAALVSAVLATSASGRRGRPSPCSLRSQRAGSRRGRASGPG